MSDDPERMPPSVEVALARLQGSIDKGFADVQGQLGLLLQRADQQDKRADSHASTIAEHDERLREVETSRPTRADLDAVQTRLGELREDVVTQDQLAGQRRQVLGWTSVIVTLVGILTGAGVSLLVAILP
ncbi:Flp pilus assembly protein TadB [Lipingzhangella halophila]|uniref:Flp pilus assembly protein TadB n=1 Tax=Lipingzhangella halophila TaxID=1783352 RepID=A0A7W7W779_9ACTN|nr:hypothetical protein [Lipingzhangella halophila]MBB4935640.1 Flp pilus assembly protein TadB [Lipingzhangella halophila]